MKPLMRGVSRVSFLVGGALLVVGMHRVIFGVRPKLIWVRDLPWDHVNAPLCFAAALGLAAFGAWLGRRSLPATTDGAWRARDERTRELAAGGEPGWSGGQAASDRRAPVRRAPGSDSSER